MRTKKNSRQSARAKSPTGRDLAHFNYLYLLLMMTVIAGILSTAMIFQYAKGEIPCPLCLLQRVAMFGVCFGIIRNFRDGFSYQNVGYSMLFAMLLLVVSVRQTLIDIYPRAGHEYVGSAIFGLHMPVWSVVIATALLSAFALQLAIFGRSEDLKTPVVKLSPTLDRFGQIFSLYVVTLCAVNLVSAILQCGFGQCHTFDYSLLQ